MAKKTINTGSGPNSRNGDSLRAAFTKINENFDELYAALGITSDVIPNLGAFEFNGSTISTGDSSSITIDQATTVTSNLTVGGDVLPNVANGGDLGSAAKPWRSLYVSDSTIYIGGNALGVDDEGELVWNNSRIAHANGEFITLDSLTDVNANSPNPGDTIVWNGGAWVNGAAGSSTGDITFAATTISAPNEDEIIIQSKDSNGFGTARVNLNSEFGGDARLRAFSSESVDTFTLANGDFTTGVWQDNGFGNGVVSFTGAQGIGDFFQNTLFKLTPDNVSITINDGTPFIWNGGANGAGTDTPGFGTNPIVPATPITITSIEFRYRSESFISVNYDNQEIRLNVQNGGIVFDANNTIQMFGDSNIELQSGENFSINSGQDISIGTGSSNSINLSTGDLNLNAFDDIRIEGRDSFRLINSSAIASIRIITDDDNNSYTWAFNPNGNVTFPDATVQTTAFTGVANIARNIESENDVSIRVNLTDSTTRIWRFGEDGNLTLPGGGNINGSDYDISIIAGDNGDNIYGTVSLVTNSFVGPGTNSLTFNSLGEITVSTVGANDGLVKWVGNSSGDGNGYTTMVLVPDTTVEGNDQYLIIDPTAPSHIHIRAGGTQDASNAELYLGGEKNNVRINDGVGVRLYNEVRDDTFSSFSDPADFNTATWYGTPGNYFVQFTEVTAGMGNLAFQFSNDAENRVTVSYGAGETSVLTYGGSASNLGGGVYRFAVVEAPPASPTVLTAIEFQIWTTNNNRIELQNNDFTVSVKDDVRITGNDIFSLRNTSSTEPITIRTDYDGADRGWEFAADGTLSTPGDIVVNGDVTGTAGASTLVLRAEPGSNTAIQLNDIVDSEIRTVANFEIRTDVSNTAQVWTFGTDGGLTFPDSTAQTTAYTGLQTSLVGAVDNNVLIRTSETVVTNNLYTNTVDFSTDVDIGGGTIISGWIQRNSEQIEISLFGPADFRTYLTGLSLGRTVTVTYSTASGNQTLTRPLTQIFANIAQEDPSNPGWFRVAGRIDATLPGDQTGIVSINFPVTTTPQYDWTFGDTGSLTFPDATVQTTAYPGPITFLNGDVRGSVFADDSTLLVDGVNGKIVGDVETARLRTTDSSIVLGIAAGETNQGVNTIAIGAAAGQANQGTSSIAIGGQAGNTAQGVSAVALGAQAGATNQGAISVSLGTQAGSTNQGLGAVAVGTQAGIISQGNYAVALGYLAGANNQPANSIVINASGSGLDGSAAGFYVNPVRNITGTSILQYNATTDEITHSNEISSEEDISIRINLSDSTQRVWRFGEDGILTLPAGGDIQDSTGTSVLGGGGSGSVLEEPFENKTSATGVIEHDATTNRLFRHTSISANFTANFTNLGLAVNEATSISLVLVQGATARMVTAVQIGGAAQTITWQGSASAPLGNANRTDVVTFSILCTATDTYTVLGMLTSFGG